MKKKTVLIILFVALITTSLGGCGKNKIGDIEVAPGQSAIYIGEDGAVSYAICESFDKEYYDKEDLEEKIQGEIDDFNAGPVASSTESAELDSFRVKDGAATAIITFISTEDFVGYEKAYNGKEEDEIFIGTIQTAQEQERKISGQFTEVTEGNATEKKEEAKKVKALDANIIIVKEKMLVQVEGEVEYISENCTVKDGIVTITDDESAYIIYK